MLVCEEKDGENGMMKFEILSNMEECFYYIRAVKSEFMRKEIRVVNPEQKLAELLPVPRVLNRLRCGNNPQCEK